MSLHEAIPLGDIRIKAVPGHPSFSTSSPVLLHQRPSPVARRHPPLLWPVTDADLLRNSLTAHIRGESLREPQHSPGALKPDDPCQQL